MRISESYDSDPIDFAAVESSGSWEDLMICVECGEEVYALAEQCPNCGHWTTDSDHSSLVWRRQPRKGQKIFSAFILSFLTILVVGALIAAIVMQTIF